MAASDARPIPRKNVAFRVTFPILDADGDLVSGAIGLDSEISKDGGTFTDVTAEATEIASGSGVYYLDLTATEMNADTVAIIVKTTSSGAKTTVLVMYPEEVGDTRIDATALATAAAQTTAQTDLDDIQSRLPAALVSGRIDASVGAMASGVVTSTAIATDAIGSDELAASAVTEIAAPVLAVLGALADAAVDGDPTTSDTMVQYLKQIVNTLCGTAGIPTFPASAAPANAVSLAEAIRQIYDEVAGLNGGALTAPLDAAGTRAALGMASANLDTQLSGIQGDTNDIQTRLPAALSGGFMQSDLQTWLGTAPLALSAQRVQSHVGSMATGIITSTTIATDAIGSDELAASAVTEIQAGLATASAVDALPTAGENADAVWDEVHAGHLTVGSTGAALSAASAADLLPTADEIADALLDRLDAVDGQTPREIFRLWTAVLGGLLNGAGTGTNTFRDLEDTKDRVVATVDEDGNRTAITLDLTA